MVLRTPNRLEVQWGTHNQMLIHGADNRSEHKSPQPMAMHLSVTQFLSPLQGWHAHSVRQYDNNVLQPSEEGHLLPFFLLNNCLLKWDYTRAIQDSPPVSRWIHLWTQYWKICCLPAGQPLINTYGFLIHRREKFGPCIWVWLAKQHTYFFSSSLPIISVTSDFSHNV